MVNKIHVPNHQPAMAAMVYEGCLLGVSYGDGIFQKPTLDDRAGAQRARLFLSNNRETQSVIFM